MDFRAFFYTAVFHSAKYDNALIRIINGVKNQGFQRCVHISFRSRNLIDDLLQNLVYVQSCFCGNLWCILGFNSDYILNFINNTLRIRTWKIYLIQYRNHIQVMIQCHVYIGKRLRLNSLGSIHNKNGSVTGRKASRNLIVKVYMSGGINQVKNILISILGFVYNTNGLGFNSNSPLSLKFHVIQNLGLHFSFCEKSRHLNNTVSKC